jgi:hypothetical protein
MPAATGGSAEARPRHDASRDGRLGSAPELDLSILLDLLEVALDSIQRCNLVGEGLRCTCGEPLSRPRTGGCTGDGVDDAVELDLPQGNVADMVFLIHCSLGQCQGIAVLAALLVLVLLPAGPDGGLLVSTAAALAGLVELRSSLLLRDVVEVLDDVATGNEEMAIGGRHPGVLASILQVMVELEPALSLSPPPDSTIFP